MKCLTIYIYYERRIILMIARGDVVELSRAAKFVTLFFKKLKDFRNSQFIVETVNNTTCIVKYNGNTYRGPISMFKKVEKAE